MGRFLHDRTPIRADGRGLVRVLAPAARGGARPARRVCAPPGAGVAVDVAARKPLERCRPRVRGHRPSPARPAERAARMKDACRPVLRLALLALALRLLLLYLRGDYIVFDEGYYLLLARSLRAGHGLTLNGLPHVALSPLQPVIVAALSFIGIPDLWASRLLAAI